MDSRIQPHSAGSMNAGGQEEFQHLAYPSTELMEKEPCTGVSVNGRNEGAKGEGMQLRKRKPSLVGRRSVSPPRRGTSNRSISQEEENEAPTRPRTLFKTFPGVFLFCFWVVEFGILVHLLPLITPYDCVASQEAEQLHEALKNSKIVKVMIALIFGICIMLDLSGIVISISPKKKQLNSMVLFINSVSFSIYISTIFDVMPTICDVNGKPIPIFVYVQWIHTTPVMIIVQSALGMSMEEDFVKDWKAVCWTIFWDELMMVLGIVHTFLDQHWIGWAAFFASCLSFVLVCRGIHHLSKASANNAATTYEMTSIQGLEMLTYMLWSAFPCIHFLHYMGFIDGLYYEILRSFVDVTSKLIYSVALLTGNFCVLDIVATLRLAQVQAEKERDSKHNAVVRAEAMNRALQMAYLEAETSARLARQFLANMSHELRTPLNAVIAFTSLVLDSRDLSPLHEEYLSSSLTSAEALLGIINQVLDFSKFHAQEEEEEEGGEEERPKSSDARPSLVQLNIQTFDLLKICDEICDILAERVNARDVDFAVEICPLLRGEKVPKLLGDPVRLRQCLVNLCDNAAKFSKDTGGQALLSVEVEEGAFGELLVLAQVWDNGDGIPKDKQPLLFVPFSQVDCKYSRKHGGTGLGLAITKKIVDAMEGSIEVFSEGPDKGSTFTMQISFPVAADGEEGLQQGSPLRMTKLSGCVKVLLPKGPGQELAVKLCESWGLKVDNFCYEQNAVPSIGKIRSLLNSFEWKGETKVVLLIDSKIHSLLIDENIQLATGKNILVVGSLDHLWEQMQRVRVDPARFLLRPIKSSLFRHKLEAAIALSSTTDSHLTVESMRTSFFKEVQFGTRLDFQYDSSMPTHVLVVEDNPVNQKVAVAMVQKTLGREHVIVDVANNGREGLANSTEHGHKYDLILMDVQMPVMDGLEATRRIREWEKSHAGEAPYFIVAVTAHASKMHVEECLEAGMNRHASKPLTLVSMRRVVEEYRDWRVKMFKSCK